MNKVKYYVFSIVILLLLNITSAQSLANIEKIISESTFTKLYPLTNGEYLKKQYVVDFNSFIEAKKELGIAQTKCYKYEEAKDWTGQAKCIKELAPDVSERIDRLNTLTGLLQNCPAISVTNSSGNKVDFSKEKPDPSVIKTITTKYTYNNFIATLKYFPGFLSNKNNDINKRELSAFLANTNQETLEFCFDTETPFNILENIQNSEDVKVYGARMIDWLSKEDKIDLKKLHPSLNVDGQTWGTLSSQQQDQLTQWFFNIKKPRGKYCGYSDCSQYQQYYYGRGALQLSYPSNYQAFSDSANSSGLYSGSLLTHPNDIVSEKYNTANGPSLLWGSAIWFWVTPQANKPSAHSVMDGSWVPSNADVLNGRKPGFGTTINIINGGLECGVAITRAGADSDAKIKEQHRIASYTKLLTTFNLAKDNPVTHPTSCELSNDFRCDANSVGKVDYCPKR